MSLHASRLQASAAKAAELLEKWLALQDVACRYMANAGNILGRMPALTSTDGYLELQGGVQLKPLLLVKQLRSFELVLGRLQAVMRELEEVVASQEKLCVDGWAVFGVSAGPNAASKLASPSIGAMQTIESMEDVWYMCRDELSLKAALLAKIHHGSSDAEFNSLSSLFCAHMHLKLDSTSVLLLRNNAWEVS